MSHFSSISTGFRIAKRELRGGLQGFRTLIACLALGVGAITGIGMLQHAIEAGLTTRGAEILGGDAELRFTYRYAEQDERAWMASNFESISEIVDFRSLAVLGEGEESEQALTQVKGVDSLYPLYGEALLEPKISLSAALAGREGFPGAVLDPLLADRLQLEIGDRFRLGAQEFVFTARLISEPDSGSAGFSLGPRSIVLLKDLEASGLLQPGTLFESRYRLKLSEEVEVNDATLSALRESALNVLPERDYRWTDSRVPSPSLAGFIENLGAFLTLVGLCGLAVGGVGVASAVRAYLASKASVIATLRSLGAANSVIFWAYFLQIGALALIGILLGLFLGAIIPILAAPLISARLPFPAEFALYITPLVHASVYGMLASVIFMLWPLGRAEEIRAAALFREAFQGGKPLPALPYLIGTTSSLVLLIISAIWFTGSFNLTIWVAAGISGALIILALTALLLARLAGYLGRAVRGKPGFRAALSAIAHRRGESVASVLALGLGLSVVAAIGQIDGTLRGEISGQLPERAPSFFIVDIQPDQIDELRERVLSRGSVSKFESAPSLRGIITHINGLPAEEVAGGHWVLEGDRGVTYSREPGPATEIIEGEWWPSDYSGPPLISFAEEEGREMGLKLGDKLTVNILGRSIEGEIANFREVNFENAGIGFILSFSPNALAGAPHSYIATLHADVSEEAAIMRELSNAYPNVTVIAVKEGIERVTELVSSVSSAIRWGAFATILTGLIVLIGTATAGQPARAYEAALLKAIGMGRSQILSSFAIRFMLLGIAASTIALIAAALGAWAVVFFVFESDYKILWIPALLTVVLGAFLSSATGLVFSLVPLRARPAQLLRDRE